MTLPVQHHDGVPDAAVSRRSSLSVLLLTFALLCFGCSRGEDSWRHYASGGHYPSGSPSMSPDGEFIVFSSPRTGQGDIYQVTFDGTTRVRLTDSPEFEADPIYSPDGLRIAFVREADGRRHIWSMDHDGTNQRQLTFGDYLDDVVGFSPDGARLFIQHGDLPTGMGRTTSDYELDLSVDPPALTRLDGSRIYSPDGTTIAVERYDEAQKKYEIRIHNADGTGDRHLAYGFWPHFSPDGSAVLYAADKSESAEQWMRINVDGSGAERLGILHDAHFTPDGQHIVFMSSSYQRDLWIMRADGTSRRRLGGPTGYFTYLRPCQAGFICTYVGADRVGDIYVVQYPEESVRRVCAIE